MSGLDLGAGLTSLTGGAATFLILTIGGASLPFCGSVAAGLGVGLAFGQLEYDALGSGHQSRLGPILLAIALIGLGVIAIAGSGRIVSRNVARGSIPAERAPAYAKLILLVAALVMVSGLLVLLLVDR